MVLIQKIKQLLCVTPPASSNFLVWSSATWIIFLVKRDHKVSNYCLSIIYLFGGGPQARAIP